MADAKITSFNLSCPVPRVADDRIVLAHGGGGRLTHQLIEKIFMPAFANDALVHGHNRAIVSLLDWPLVRAWRPSRGSCWHFGEQDGL